MELKEGTRVYIIAICGTGMSALAGLLKEKKCVVAGSDLACYSPVKELLEDLQIPVCIGYDVKDLQNFSPDYVVIGNFVRKDNPQAQYVMKTGLPYTSLPGCLEEHFLSKTQNLVVVGTHGKSTTSTLIAHLLSKREVNPGFMIGAVSQSLRRSFQLGSGQFFVLEGDEYDTAFFDKESKFLHYRPHIGVWTSLEYDHADIFPSMDRLEEMFLKFLALLPEEGRMIYCSDHERMETLIRDHPPAAPLWSYGFNEGAEFRLKDFEQNADGLEFHMGGQDFKAPLTGSFNALNIAGAALAVHAAGFSMKDIAEDLKSFGGLKRRQEVIYQNERVKLVDDFAHHPSAIKEVLSSFRQNYPEHWISVFFEPRSNTTRRAIFQKEFVSAFVGADAVYLPEVFRKEALAAGDALNIQALLSDLAQESVDAKGPLTIHEIVEESVKDFQSQGRPGIFLVLSNGSFEGLHGKLKDKLSQLSEKS